MDIKGVGAPVQKETVPLQKIGAPLIPLEEVGDPRKQPLPTAGLCEVFVRPQPERLQLVLHLVPGSQDQDRDSGLLLQIPADLKAADLRQIDV